ncbi:acetyl-CoA C-acetyltransferase [Dietzia sp. CQ4]|uniref:acetyl-CoA C-acetyltransferase n=1 Tax=Dietzia TaxID=37914 RepID=UPI0015FBF48C|nr:MULTISPECIES: acetyl-CoA C-acetyltransferase [unclassified Dietzia]MBB1033558.1 acetyl-CoA C-acetyltransferase [Dietzia sp. CQ4]MBB1040591.1 acetyl-CoA C-acetyltransferase [Dietzia sp. Cai40]MBB1046123.1 acetyl-CoA C-acetyltransferase [Dietzia sp. DQ11-44]
MRDVVICQPLRTPVGRFGGVFRDLDANTLATSLLTALVERTGLTGADVDDVILGQGSPGGEGPAIGRIAALDSPLGIDVPGMQLDRRCGSGLQAVITGALQVASGGVDLVVAGGVESMSQVEFYATPSPRWGITGDGVSLIDRLGRARTTVSGRSHVIDGGMIETAENLRREYGITREEQDRLAVQSHQRAVAAQESGVFAEEIVPVAVPQRRGGDLVVDTDEHPRADTTVEALSGLRAIMGRTDPEATVTAGNASGQNDGAAMCVVTTVDRAASLGLTPLVRLASWAVAGVAPETMGIGPVPATARALDRLGLTLADIDVIELNEAFAAQALSVMREWDIDPASERLNPHGSGISLGHPVGATGARMLATLSHEMVRRDAQWGLETMCIGGGQGLAAVFERV